MYERYRWENEKRKYLAVYDEMLNTKLQNANP